MLIYSLYSLAIFFLLHGFYSAGKYIFTTRIMGFNISLLRTCRDANDPCATHGANFIVLAPVLHEESTVEAFLKGLQSQRFPKDNYEVWLITTEREMLNARRPNTIDSINRIRESNVIKRLQLKIIHYPNAEGSKSDQLSFAWRRICERYQRNYIADSYFLLLDADSVPDENLIQRFNQSLEKNVCVYQQPLLWVKNLSKLKSRFMQSFAFQQTFFSLSYEIPMFSRCFMPWRLQYCVGHGLCVKGEFLQRIGGFPSIIEDVRIGRMCCFLGEPIKVIKGFGSVETAKSFRVYIKQCSVWFYGCALFFFDYLRALELRESKRPQVKDVALLGYGLFKAFRWLNKGLIHFLLLAASILLSSTALAVMSISSLIVNSCLPVALVAVDLNAEVLKWDKGHRVRSGKIVVNAVLFAPLFYLVNFLGVYLGLWRFIRFCIRGNVYLPKTER